MPLLLWLTIMSTAPAADEAALALDVIIVNDPDLPLVGDAEAKGILDEAQATVTQKLGFSGLSFNVRGRKTLAQFLDSYAPLGDSCLQSFESVRVRPGKHRAQDVDKSVVVPFLSRWKLDELKAFFPTPPAGVTTHEQLAEKLLAEFD